MCLQIKQKPPHSTKARRSLLYPLITLGVNNNEHPSHGHYITPKLINQERNGIT